MKSQALQGFIPLTQEFEGAVYTMYKDKLNLVTVGWGNLIEPIQLGRGLPWHRADGSLATQSEYIAEWNLINDTPGLAEAGWMAAARLCKLHLTKEAVDNLVRGKIVENEYHLRVGFPGYDAMGADLQLFLHSMAWACGARFWEARPRGYPRLRKLINDGKYLSAMAECDINPKVGTIILRNAANRQMLTNAFYANLGDMDKETLFYPGNTVHTEEDFSQTTSGIQHALSMLGWNIKQDGIMGPLTRSAIMKFQEIHKLKVDGIVGPVTYEAMHSAMRHR